jgi:hypothetical protein
MIIFKLLEWVSVTAITLFVLVGLLTVRMLPAAIASQIVALIVAAIF